MKRTLLISLLTLVASSIFAQTKIGHVWYQDKGNEVYYGNQILFRTDHTNIDTLTSITWGSIAYDTVNQVVVVYDGSSWVDLVSGANNTLDDAYDEGGSGAGRLITADNGAVQINGPFNSTIGNIQLVHDSVDVPVLGYTDFTGVYEFNSPDLNVMGYWPDGFGSSVPEFRTRAANGDTVVTLSLWRGKNSIDQFFNLEATYSGVGNYGYEVQMVSGHPQTKMYATNSAGTTNLAVVNVDTTEIAFEFDGSFPLRADPDSVFVNGSLQYVDGNESNGYHLVSDANGVASWEHTFAYGEMGFGDSSSTIALTQNTPAWVTNGNNNLWSEGASTFSDVTYSNDSIICNADGIYEINLRLSGDLALNDVLKVGVYKNGTLSCTCQGQITSPIGGTVEITYVDIISLSADDALQVYITNTANDNDFDAVSAKMIIHKVGN